MLCVLTRSTSDNRQYVKHGIERLEVLTWRCGEASALRVARRTVRGFYAISHASRHDASRQYRLVGSEVARLLV